MDIENQYWPVELAGYYRQQGYHEQSTLFNELTYVAAQQIDKVAVNEGVKQLTYRQLVDQVEQCAAGLLQQQIHAGDRVLVQLPNCLNFVIVSFALFRLGAVPVFVMPGLRERELRGVCEVAEPVACIVADSFLGFDHKTLVETLAARTPSLRTLIIDGKADSHTPLADVLQGNATLLASVAQPEPEQLALLLLSGGTTGTPKLIPRTHADYLYNARASAQVCGFSEQTVYLAALPVAHNFPLACPGLIGTLLMGGEVVMSATPGFDACFELIEAQKVTATALVPALVPGWLDARKWDDCDLSSLQLLQVGGARLEADVAARIQPEMGCQLQQVFGMAEGLLCFTRLDDPPEVVLNSQGRPLCDSDDVRVVDDQGEDLPVGEAGELLVRGPYTIRGYYRAEVHNQRTFTADGYYCSGDRVVRREDGNLCVVGRLKEQINRAGEKIAVAEIEALMQGFDLLREAISIAVPDERLGERHCLCVIHDNGQAIELPQIHHYLQRQGLARHKLPDQLLRCSRWPLTAIGKVDRNALVKEAQVAQASVAQTAAGPSSHRLLTWYQAQLPTRQGALPLAAALMATERDPQMSLFECNGQWQVSLGAVARITLRNQRLTLSGEQLITQQWPVAQMAELPSAMESALATLPLREWYSWGTAQFEMARAIYDLPLAGDAPLLELIVPAAQVLLCGRQAQLRSVDPQLLAELQALLQKLDREPENLTTTTAIDAPVATANSQSYQQKVAAAVTEINRGDYQKVILSRPVPLAQPLDMVASYLSGRQGNTPARSFLIRQPGFSAAGFSPETVVEVSAQGEVSTQPLAGTRALGDSDAEEKALRKELLSDTKEIAEHAVSVKLAFEELEPICLPGSLKVSEFMTICRRGTVQHLGSRLKGQLQLGLNRWHAFNALFPAVTVSGIPKRESIEAIGRHEGQPRGLYSGSVFIADSNGMLDAALVLRSFYQQQERNWLQAGAGLVSLSTPERELEETCEKLASTARYLVAAPIDVLEASV